VCDTLCNTVDSTRQLFHTQASPAHCTHSRMCSLHLHKHQTSKALLSPPHTSCTQRTQLKPAVGVRSYARPPNHPTASDALWHHNSNEMMKYAGKTGHIRLAEPCVLQHCQLNMAPGGWQWGPQVISCATTNANPRDHALAAAAEEVTTPKLCSTTPRSQPA